jgi:hypothetical protein
MLDKRDRRTKAEIVRLREALQEIVEAHKPLTARAMFYLAVGAGLVAKNEHEYSNTIVRLLGIMREEWLDWRRYREPPRGAVIPFGSEYIVDASRWTRKPTSYSGAEAALQDTARFYRRDLWRSSPVYVAFYCEKETIADLVYRETAEWDVPLSVFHGFSSKGYLWENAAAIEAAGKPAWLYFLRDHDPSGERIFQSAVRSLERYASPDTEIHLEQLAVTPEQIRAWDLPTRPTKTAGNAHAKNWRGGDSVEVDAIPPERLRAIINAAIEQHVNKRAFKVIKVAERSERELMEKIAGNLPGIQEYLSGQ